LPALLLARTRKCRYVRAILGRERRSGAMFCAFFIGA
jgi:hypothetical protein